MSSENNDYRNSIQDQRLSKIESHIEIINHELGHVQTDVAWLKKFFWIIASASIGGLIAGLLNLFF